jgi:hypothetical protein
VSPLRVNELIRQCSRRTATLAVVAALGAAVALGHGGLEESHMTSAAAWCVAVLPAAATAVLVAGATVPLVRVRGVMDDHRPSGRHDGPAVQPRARDGPTRLTVLRL